MNQVQIEMPLGFNDDGSENFDEQALVNEIVILRRVFNFEFEAIADALNEKNEPFPRGPNRKWDRKNVMFVYLWATEGIRGLADRLFADEPKPIP